ncbi:MAG TPA: TolC family protein [Bryobacterales bacterium]|nr:TolC family protein [Bryobacterales bacterium]
MRLTWIAPSLAGICFASAARGQFVAPGGAPQAPRETSMAVPASSPAAGVQGPISRPFSGSVPTGQATAAVVPLSLGEAIERGLKYNLGLLLEEQSSRLAQGARYRARSALLPNVAAGISETGQQINLAAFGFSGFPGIGNIVGPFNIFDTRASVSQPILDLRALRNDRTASENVRATQYSYDNAKSVVVLAVTSLYLEAIAGAARIDAAQAQLATAQALYDQAVDLRKAGVIPGIEVIRAQVEKQAQQQRLIFFQNEYEKEKLNLARAIGLPLGQQIRLSDALSYTAPPAISQQQALEQAYHSRADYQNALALVRAAESARRAASAEALPSVSLDGNYGDIGPRIYNSHGTFLVAASVRIPVFQGGRVRGDVLQADALLRQRTAESEDLRARIDYEIRTAFLDLKSAGDRVEVARSTLDLAKRQLAQSQDRFAAGIADNIEVVQAQDALATATENYISSLYAYNLAKVSLARALGFPQGLSKPFLEGTR